MQFSRRGLRSPSPDQVRKQNKDRILADWENSIWPMIKDHPRKITYRGDDQRVVRLIIGNLVNWHVPYKIIKHGVGMVTVTTVDVTGKCLCCGAKDVTLCQLAGESQ